MFWRERITVNSPHKAAFIAGLGAFHERKVSGVKFAAIGGVHYGVLPPFISHSGDM